MKLFEIIPDNFFSILSSPLKEIYADGLFLLYEQYRTHTSFGINREILTQILTDYFEGMGEEPLFEVEEAAKSAREKANFLIRKLNECKWIDIEVTSSYTQIVNLNDYAISIIETLDKIIKNERLEYQGYVYTIYSILFSNDNNQYNIILDQVYENSNKLISGLKTLNSNIKKYIERVTQQKTSEEILKLHFEGYSQDIVDKGYHRLKTSDHVSKFRPRILAKLEELRRDTEYIKTACRLEVEMERAANTDEAYEVINRKLNEIIYAFDNMDQIINEIDRKNNQYIRASLARIKYLLNSSKDTGGQITDILKYMAALIEDQKMDIKDEIYDWIGEMLSVFPQSFVDERSLYSASEGKKAFNPQKLNEDNILSEEEREKVLQRVREKKEKRMSRENIDKYISKVLEDKSVINASQLPLEGVNDFLRVIYILIYSKSKLIHYKLRKLDSPIIKGSFTFNDFEIWRK